MLAERGIGRFTGRCQDPQIDKKGKGKVAMSKVKKMLGVLMAAMLCFALTPITAFADEGKGTITIEPQSTEQSIAGHEYDVYQLVVGDVATKEGKTYLSNAKAGANLKEGSNVGAILEEVKLLSDSKLANTLWNYVNEKSTPFAVLNEDNRWTDNNVPYGYYIISDRYVGNSVTDGSDAISRYMVQVVGNVTVKTKSVFTTLDKIIADQDDDPNTPVDTAQKVDTAAIGDVIDYQLKSSIPDMDGYKIYKYVVTDTMSKGLTFNKDKDVKVVFGDTEVALTEYMVTTTVNNDDLTTSIVIDLKNLKALAAKYKVEAGTAITISYSATINANAEIGKVPNTNTAVLSYSNNPQQSGSGTPEDPNVTGTTPESTTYTYVTQLSLFKVDANTQDALTGAVFTLSGNNLENVVLKAVDTFQEDPDGNWYKLKDGTYTDQAPLDNTESLYANTTQKYTLTTVLTEANTPEDLTGKIVAEVDASGVLVFKGLNKGTYTLEEIQAPETYNKLLEPIVFEINPSISGTNLDSWTVTVTPGAAEISDDGSGVLTTTINNGQGLELPSTGGIGTTIFYIVGGILVIGAIAFLIVRRRNSAAK